MLFTSEAMQKVFFELKDLDRFYEGKFPCNFRTISKIEDFATVNSIILGMLAFEKKLNALYSEIYDNFFNCYTKEQEEIFIDFLKIEEKIKKTREAFCSVINQLMKVETDKETIKDDNKEISKKLTKIYKTIDKNFFPFGEINKTLKEVFEQKSLHAQITILSEANALVFARKEKEVSDYKQMTLER